jgi:hypothetical protein
MSLRVLAASMLALVSAAALAEPSTLRLLGYAYDLDTKRYAYTEVHHEIVDGDRWLRGTVTYVLYDGSLLARKTLDFSADPYVPDYRLELLTEGRVEGVRGAPGALEMFRQEGKGRPLEVEQYGGRPSLLAADAGVHPLIRDHFAELAAGNPLKFRLLVCGSLDVFRFRAWRAGDATFEGRPVVRIRVEPDSLLNWLSAPIELTYDPERRKLVEYQGQSNIRDPLTHKQYNVHILYSSTPPADAPKLPPGY